MKPFSTLLVLTCCVVVCMPNVARAQSAKANRKRETNRARRAARSLSLLAANGGGTLLRSDLETVAGQAELMEWVEKNKTALVNASPNPFTTPTKWGVATANGNSLFLHITAWPKKGAIVIPRLHNSVIAAKFTHKDEPLKLTPNVDRWEIAIPPKPRRYGNLFHWIIELQLDHPPQLGVESPPVVQPNDDGAVRLHARYAVTHGQLLRFEPQPHKNTVGYWTKEDDWVEWAFEPKKDQTYEIVVRYGCGNGQGGSEIEIQVGQHTVAFTVEATGGFQAWREVSLGDVSGLNGTTRLIVKPTKKAKTAVMDIQEISLKPR